MFSFFFNKRKSIRFTQYEDVRYTFNGQVKSFLYKVWDSFYGKDVESFITPNTQDYIKLNSFGNLDFIEIHKTTRIGRKYVDNVFGEKGATEEPISYYRQFFSGGTKFYYDDENRLIKYVIDERCKYGSPRYYEVNYHYDDKNNRYSSVEDNTREYNDKGQLIFTSNLIESDEYHGKTVYEYDSEDRIKRILEYGYRCELDDSGSGNDKYFLAEGIQLLFSSDYKYHLTEEGELECVCQIIRLRDDERHIETTVFNKFGHTKSHLKYFPNGKLDTVYHLDWIYDDRLNWVKLTIRRKYHTSEKLEIYQIHLREIQYA